MMKPRAGWREEPWWHWDWPGRPNSTLQPGNGGNILSTNDPGAPIAAKLIVPDAATTTGWRDWYVYHNAPKHDPRRMGFK